MESGSIPGMVTVEPEVLETIARFSALSVPGVVQLVEKDVDRILGLQGKSVGVHVDAGRVTVDLSIVAGPDLSLLRLGRTVQYEVTRAIQNMIGMPVDAVNIHIEDVVYPKPEGYSEALDN